MRKVLAAALLTALAAALAGPARAGDETALRNGDLTAWKDGRPEHWNDEVGATLGFGGPTAPASRLEPLEGGGAASVGDAGVLTWRLWKQAFPAQPGACYRLDFEARAEVVQEGMQYDNCWVGLLFHAANGQRLSFDTRDARSPAWRSDLLQVRAPAGAQRGEAAFFCSLSGRFEVRHLRLRRVEAAGSYDTLVQDFDRHYPFFAAHHIDWQALVEGARAKAVAATSPAAFADALTPLLAPLEDPHVWVDLPSGARRQPHQPAVEPNFDVRQVLARLASQRQVIRNVIAGRTKDGYGYLALGTMQGSVVERDAVDAAWRSLFDAPALVLDLRVNSGGQEVWGQRLLGCLTSEPVLYARSLVRGGPAHDDLRGGGERRVPPRTDAHYAGPVVALVGPACISSGEGMALMCKALPQVTLVGLPTRGASGNPQPVPLPNGVTVWCPSWISLQPDGTSIERRGVAPDVRVEPAADTDTAFDAALRLLRERLK